MHSLSTPASPLIALPAEKLASLRTISLHHLEHGSIKENLSLLQTCVEDGFFYLDLTHPDHVTILDCVRDIFDMSEELFRYPDEVKNLFDVDKVSRLKLNGYKPKGRNITSKDGRGDGFESWALPRNGLLQLSGEAFPHPPLVAAHQDQLRTLIRFLNRATHTIMSSLSTSLLIPDGQRFEEFQGLDRPSPDLLRLLKYHANTSPVGVPQTPHTDMGSLTFVFSDVPGLQVLPVSMSQKPAECNESDWLYVVPKPGHAIVNVGDCLTMMSNGLLKSALHRVGPVAGCAMPERYSMAYLARPEDHAVLRGAASPLLPRIVSEGIDETPVTSGAWIEQKFKALRGKDVVNKAGFDQVITGGRGVLV
ncbi:hypothetical protein E4U35_004126 [Claviceps purpurea]|nr:hypothetical protein E4U35_004126 [Claviceps purpurea]KAG6214840.1 hypothetical protein E4U34_005954 [Claviceps purpurea]KAG6261454.1 hypothetical protein E4U49_003941 [Claviceps purpurea]KAG6265769.1 hypothetical protein E4U48_005812 [Claviceps purpurea]KAG6311938.1 hypothetical protein E4U44_003754 [Claviceps purpurea]